MMKRSIKVLACIYIHKLMQFFRYKEYITMKRSKEVFTCVYIKALTEFIKVLETYSNE